MRRQVMSIILGALIGLAVLALAIGVGGTGGYVVLGVYWALCLAQQVYCRFLLAGRVRASLAARVDPSAGPPEGATLVDDSQNSTPSGRCRRSRPRRDVAMSHRRRQ